MPVAHGQTVIHSTHLAHMPLAISLNRAKEASFAKDCLEMAMAGALGSEGEGLEQDTATMTVTIVLDPAHPAGAQQHWPDEADANGQEDFAVFLAISPPPSPSQLLAKWANSSNGLFVRHLPPKMAHLLEIRLNPPVCGSMRNWEFLAAHLGLSLEEIVGMRRNENPTGNLLRKFGHELLLKLLELVGQAGRIDVLLSVSRFVGKISPSAHQHHPRAALPGHLASPDSALSSTFSTSRPGPSHSPPREPFLLLLHHEMAQSRDLRRFQRMLFKNLDRYGQENGVKLVDVDQCMAGEDLLGSVQRHFEGAWQVLLVLSPDYALAIAGEGGSGGGGRWTDQRTELKRNLHQMTFQEVLYNRGENRRFRVVLMQGTRPEDVPRGWPSNTLHYRFPEDFAELCERVFEGTPRS